MINRPALLTFLLAALTVYQLSVSAPPPQFSGFTSLKWSKLNGCAKRAAPVKLFHSNASLGNYKLPKLGSFNCESKAFTPQNSILEFFAAGDLGPGSSAKAEESRINVLSESGELKAQFPLYLILNDSTKESWGSGRLELPQEVLGTSIRLQVTGKKTARSWFALRDRVNFYSQDSALYTIHKQLNRLHTAAISVLASLLLTLFLFECIRRPFSDWSYFILVFFVSLAVHFRWEVFFYFDEWTTLYRFKTLGFAGITRTHNEHFLPVFFSWYYLAAKICKANYQLYIIIGLLLHALNALLAVKLLSRVSLIYSKKQFSLGICQALGVFFAVNSLNSEVLQWAFGQPVLLAQLFQSACLISALYFCRNGGALYFVSAVLCALNAPFCFGNGFAIIFCIASVVFLMREGKDSQESRRALIRALSIALAAALSLMIPGLLYVLLQERGGQSLPHTAALDSPLSLTHFIFIGTQFGTILRGLGLFPQLNLGRTLELYKLLQVSLNLKSNPETFLAVLGGLFGALLLIVALCFAWKSNRRKELLRIWLLGQALLFSSFILPAVGRWQFGAQQSLSLRYHYGALLGLLLMLLPLLLVSFKKSDKEATSVCQILLGVLAALSLFSQLKMGSEFMYYRNKGLVHSRYAAELADWEAHLDKLYTGQPIDHVGRGTELKDLLPVYPKTLTPGQGPNQAYGVLNYLDPFAYPAYRPWAERQKKT